MTTFISAFIVFLALSFAGFLAGGGTRRERLVWVAVPVLASLAAAALYVLGNAPKSEPAELALVPVPPQVPMTLPAQGGGAPSVDNAGDMNVMAARLAARLARNPDDGPGWALLARAYAWMGRDAEADAAFAKAARLQPADSQLKADWDKLRAKAGAGSAAASAAFVAGTVRIADSLFPTPRPSDTVFVVARAPGGAGPPLAVKRFSASELPARFRLDDHDAMMPGRSLAAAAEVELVARLSASGNALRQPSDVESPPVRVKPGGENVTLEIGPTRD